MEAYLTTGRRRQTAARLVVAGLGMVCFCLSVASSAVAEPRAVVLRPKRLANFQQSAKADIQIAWPGGGQINPGSVFHASFPAAMVPTGEIGVEGKPSPIRIDPELPGKWSWKSQTEGVFTVGEAVRPGENFKLMLVGGLKDLQGNAVESDTPVAERKSSDFKVSASFQVGPQEKRPSGGLRFTYPVLPTSIAEAAWFQDRDNRKQYPVDVVVSDPDPKTPVTYASISPREDLPKGRTFDLIVEGISETGTGYRLPEIFVQPLGTTEPLRVLKIAAYNRPQETPGIAIDFNDDVDPDEGLKIRIEPPVKGVKFLTGRRSLLLEGPFDTRLRYKVTVPTSVVGSHGWGLTSESRWSATFHRKKPTIIFPSQDVCRRSQLGFQLPLIQVNTGPLQWRLARVPPEKLRAVQSRLREFTQIADDPLTGDPAIDPETDVPMWKPTEVLIGVSRLETVAQGAIAPSPEDVDTLREIAWSSTEKLPSGPCVLEVTGTNAAGKTIGNRTLISFTEVGVLQKEFGKSFSLRVTHLADGRALSGVKVRAVTEKNCWRAEGSTDAQGLVEFSKTDLFPPNSEDDARWFLLETPQGLMFQPVRGNGYYADRYYEGDEDSYVAGHYRSSVVTDRPIYRPGHTVKFKGIFRVTGDDEALEIPWGTKVSWGFYKMRDEDDSREAIASGTATLDEFGGFDGEWKIPVSAPVNRYQLRVQFPWAVGTGATAMINVQEFRPPPFTVALTDIPQPDGVAGLRVKSNYFHGAANAGARVKWTAVWRRLLPKAVGRQDDEWVLGDIPRVISGQEDEHNTTGEGVLGLDGTVELKVKQPFTDGFLRGWYSVEWTVDVTGSDGQTITEPAETSVYAVPVVLGIKGRQVPGVAKQIVVEVNAYGPDENPSDGTPVKVEIFQVIDKSVKEQIAPHVFRYQNTTRYEKVQTLNGVTPFNQSVPVNEPGEYFIGVRHAENEAVPTALRRVSVSGDVADRPAEFAQQDEAKFEVKSDQETYAVGEKAVLHLQAPFAGMAWVSVEAGGKILDGFEHPMESNASRLELPVKKEYFPNAWVNIYLMKPGGADRVPAERFGSVKLVVQRPELDLKVAPLFSSKEARPGERVSGEIQVTSVGQPAAGADVTAFAVDESYLVAGGWRPPEFLKAFYPQRAWDVSSFFSGLDRLSQKIAEEELTQKGFIVGDGDEGNALGPKKPMRKEFLPLAWWQTGLRTDANGKVAFSFKAPDSLTRYRVIALVQTKESQFGCGSDSVEISKPVQIEPALPRFIRVGDSVELRAIVRQKVADALPVTLRCSSGLTLEGDKSQTQTVQRGVPSVFRFRAKVGEVTSAKIQWETDAGPGDAVEMTLPVHPPTLLRKEAVFATLGAGNPLEDLHRLVPSRWAAAVGNADVMLSTSPWLPKIMGLPLLLEYPHGCFEQISSRVLGYTVLGDLLAYLPDGGAHDQEYRKRVDDGLQRMNAALKTGGYLPYWPSDTEASAFPTIAGYWSARCAKANGWEVPPRLLDEMPKAVRAIAEGKDTLRDRTPFHRCFAMMVLSEGGEEAQKFEPILRDLYLRRERYDEESRSLLAIAMHRFGVLSQEKEQLLREIDRPMPEREFDPDTFSSTTRTQAMRALAFATVHPEENDGKTRQELKKRIEELLDSSRSLSTQENFWLLFAFKAMHAQVQSTPVDFGTAAPVPTEVSRNKLSAAWTGQDIRKIREFAPALSGSNTSLGGLSCLLDAQYRMESADLENDNRTDRGFRVERVVKNMTAPARTGEASAPYKLGDQLLITIRLISPKVHHYVAVEGELPACLETINPNIESVARSYSIPMEEGDRQLGLSYSELRDKTTCLYFNRVEPGVGVYSVLARVTSAGSFRWPATQAVPMYDSRFTGVSAASVVNAAGE